MRSDLDQQASCILNALAQFPGGARFTVTSRRYARVGPADFGVTFEERIYRCTTSQLPSVLDLTKDADEVTIILEGLWPGPIGRCELIDSVSRILEERTSIAWDVRAQVVAGTESRYRLTVFNDAGPAVAE